MGFDSTSVCEVESASGAGMLKAFGRISKNKSSCFVFQLLVVRMMLHKKLGILQSGWVADYVVRLCAAEIKQLRETLLQRVVDASHGVFRAKHFKQFAVVYACEVRRKMCQATQLSGCFSPNLLSARSSYENTLKSVE